MAEGIVKQIIQLIGVDQASKTVGGVKESIGSLGKATDTVAERSGDLERGFRGVKDILGNVAGIDLGPVTDGLGGIEAVIKGFGAALNPITIGFTAVAGAAYLVYQQSEKARTNAINLQIKEIEIAKETVEATAKRLKLSNELLGIEDKTKTVQEVQADARANANKLLDAEKSLKEATLEKDKDKIRAAEEEISRVKDLIVQDEIRLSLAKVFARDSDIYAGNKERQKREELQREDAINGIMNEKERIQRRSEARAIKFNQLKLEEEKILYRLNLGDKNREEQEKRLTEIYLQRKALSAEELADAKEVENKRKEAASKGRQYAADERAALATLAQARADAAAAAGADAQAVFELQMKAIEVAKQAEIKAAQQSEGTQKARAAKIEAIELAAAAKQEKLREDAFSRTAELQKASEDAAKRLADAQIANADAIRKAQIAAATDPAAKADLVIADLKIQAERRVQEVKDNGLLADSERSARIIAIGQETAAAVTAAEEQKAQAIKEGAAKARAETQKVIDQSADIVSNAATLVSAYQGKDGIGTALLETAKQVKSVTAGWTESKNKTGDIIGAVGNVAAAFVDGEREKAGVLALMETAAAAVAIATGDIPGAIAHGTAAALYGSVAGGLIGGGASAAPAATGGGGFAATAAGGGGGAGGPAGATVINFNAPLGTAYEIGKSVVKAQKAAGASGWSPKMAMGV